jgi:hypothetical protein
MLTRLKFLNVAAVNSEPPTNVRKQKILAKTPHSKTNGSYESLQNGSICTWVTPLHVSTPVDALCQNTNCNTELMHLRSDNLQGTMNVNYVNATPKVVGPKSKSNLEKDKTIPGHFKFEC